TLEELERNQAEQGYEAIRSSIDPLVEAVIANGVYEIVASLTAEGASALRPRSVGDDDAILARLRAGDEAAFEQLVSQHDAALHRVARTFVPTQALADDVVHETWLRVIRRRGGPGDVPRRDPRTRWLRGTLVAAALDLHDPRQPRADASGAGGAQPAV